MIDASRPGRPAGGAGPGGAAALQEILTRALWPPALVFGVHLVLSRGLHAYDELPSRDLAMHLVGGGAIACCFARTLDALQRHGTVAALDPKLRLVLIFASTCSAAVFWEFAEFLSDRFLGTSSQLGLEDTLADMLLGIVGGVVFLLGPRGSRSPASTS